MLRSIKWIHYLFRRVWHFFWLVYEKLKIPKGIAYLKFFFHRYPTSLFSPRYAKANIKLLFACGSKSWLDGKMDGKLVELQTWDKKAWYLLKNLILFRAPQSRLEKIMIFSFLTLSIEIYNPFTEKILKKFILRKKEFLERVIVAHPEINGRKWEIKEALKHVDLFYRGSLLQEEIIKNIKKVCANQKEPLCIKEVKRGLKSGLHPLLVTTGCSGAYWMRNEQKEILGLFKPFDEEIHAPNNPVGPVLQGALGQRIARLGVRVGESAHREVAAFLVDQFFGFGIVPKTYFASFSHQVFYSAREDRFGKRAVKTKFGSFQEFLEGFTSASKIEKEERDRIALIEFQLMVMLDVIIGNSDRNVGNIMLADEKIAAIDHGLCFPDVHEELSTWYWSYFSQGDLPLHQVFIDLLANFPYEELKWKLIRHCNISLNSCERMRERVALFYAGALQKIPLKDLGNLMVPEQLNLLSNLDFSLKNNAYQIASQYLPESLYVAY